jgi:hypothetical protein
MTLLVFFYHPQPTGLNVARYQRVARVLADDTTMTLTFDDALLRKPEPIDVRAVEHYVVLPDTTPAKATAMLTYQTQGRELD